jgi:hypothetical protein
MTRREPSGESLERAFILATNVAAEIGSRSHLLTSRPNLKPRFYAACSVMRGRALLIGMMDLISADRGDVAGVLMRSLWEGCIVGTWILLKGPEAAAQAAEAHMSTLGTINRRVSTVDLSEFLVGWEDANTGPKVRDIVRELGPLLENEDRETEGQALLEQGYDFFYKAQSTFDTDASVGTFLRYSNDLGIRYEVKQDGGSVMPPAPMLLVGSTWLAAAAKYVLRHHSISTERIEEVGTRLAAALETERLRHSGGTP